MVSDSPSQTGGTAYHGSPKSYIEQFHEVFPYYLSIGMTYAEFWDGDPILAADYRKAEELRNRKRNEELWLQGMYIYEAILDASPILHAFAKRGTKPKPYSEKPYCLTEADKRYEREQREKTVHDKGLEIMKAWVKRSKDNGKESKEIGGDS